MNVKTATPRFLLIDGLRGVAALAVLFFHIATSEFFRLSPGVLGPVNGLFRTYGFLGVEIFFVISGFVIAYSLRNARINSRFAGKFVIRRSLRLDPPYWSAMLLAITFSICLTRLFHATTFPIPSGTSILAHLLYLQGIAGKPQIVIVFWTLCYEIQFYLFYLFLQFVAQRAMRSAVRENYFFQAILLVTGAASFFAFLSNNSVGPWAYNWWFLFACGALLSREMFSKDFMSSPFIGMIAMAIGLWTGHLEIIAGALTLLVLYAAFKLNGLCTWLSTTPIQYLGRISYSLYLTHTTLLQILTSVLLRVRLAPRLGSIPAFFVMLFVPIIFAEAFYRVIEGPSHRWAMKFGRKDRSFPTSPLLPACPETTLLPLTPASDPFRQS